MTQTLAPKSQPHVLVIDDDEIMRSMAQGSLAEAGFQVAEAENGLQALRELETIRPDIILLDVLMPEMDGYETAAAIRRLSGFEMVPILIMTALDDLDSINRAYEAGATDFVTKPINWVILVQRIRYMMRAVQTMNDQKRLQKELQQAQKLEAVATLAGGVAHDFNNLLQAILGSAELLRMDRLKDAPGISELEDIIAAVERGGKLVRQLLTYSRKIRSVKRPIRLNHRVKEVHQLLQRTLPKMIAMELHLADDLHHVNADAVQMEQVLMNLAINAKDAMPEGGKLVIETANVDRWDKDEGPPPQLVRREGVQLSIVDTGKGMSGDTREHIFEPFFSTKAPGKGTGLGLSMVHGIVRNHDGQITCRSTPGEGTRFDIYLPAVDELPRETRRSAKAARLEGHETLLLVDDDEVIRRASQKRLEKAGYKVLTASDGEKALEIYGARAGEIDLVLLDLIMPGIGGVKCLETMLKIDPRIRFVIISGHIEGELDLKKITSKTPARLRKPFGQERLLTTVREALDAEAPPAPARKPKPDPKAQAARIAKFPNRLAERPLQFVRSNQRRKKS
ncbi:MAG: response regulator [Desulfobacterales bacterium]|jgi:signal transduction histidine kinase